MSATNRGVALSEELRAVAEAGLKPGQPQPLFDAAALILAEAPGWRLLTVMAVASERLELVRLYSSDTANYPLGGRKSKRGLLWSDRVLVRGEPYVGNDTAGLRWAFDDSATLESLGLGAVINQPIRWNGRVIGTLNLLDVEGSYDAPWQTGATAAVAALLRPALIDAGYQPSA